MNLKLVRELMRKDIQDILKNRYVFFSIFLVPLLLAAIGILGTVSIVSTLGSGNNSSAATLASVFSSMFVLIPAILTTLVGSTSVIVEKNNHSLEPLLATPITESEFLAGKAFAPFVIGVLITWVAYTAFITITDLLTYNIIGHLLFPTDIMYVAIFFLTPVIAMLGTFAALFVSSKMKDIRAAQQVSSLVVLPILALVYLPLYAASSDLLITLILGAVLLLADIALFIVSVKAFKRESILILWT